MAQPTQNPGRSGSGSAGDTLEFLKIMGMQGQQQAPAPAPAPRRAPARDDEFESAAMRAYGAPPAFDVATLSMPPITSRPDDPEPKPVVIKGGPRRVVRADGMRPDTDVPRLPRRFALSSGHALFSRRRRMPAPVAVGIGLAGLVLVAVIVAGCWVFSNASIRAEKQADLIGTSSYDTVLSLTPANDGGYYTVLFVTSTPTDEQSIGALSQVVMLRSDKAVTQAIKVSVPNDLAVSSTTYGTHSLADVLSDPERGVNAALQGIVNNFGIRLYECAVMDQATYDQLAAVMNGRADASSIDQEALVGTIRTSFTTQQLVDFAAKIAAAGGEEGMAQVTSPLTVAADVNGSPVEATNSDQYAAALQALINPAPAVDEWGNPAGTVYQTYEDGSLVFGEDGLPVVAG